MKKLLVAFAAVAAFSAHAADTLTVAATPGYFATMGAEAAYLRRRAERLGPSAADYTRDDTLASLSMGVLSLLAPMVLPRLLKPFVPGRGKLGKALLGTAVGAIAVTTVADALARRAERPPRCARPRKSQVHCPPRA